MEPRIIIKRIFDWLPISGGGSVSRRPLVPGQYLHIYISTHCLVLAITSELSQCRNLQQSIAPQHRAPAGTRVWSQPRYRAPQLTRQIYCLILTAACLINGQSCTTHWNIDTDCGPRDTRHNSSYFYLDLKQYKSLTAEAIAVKSCQSWVACVLRM